MTDSARRLLAADGVRYDYPGAAVPAIDAVTLEVAAGDGVAIAGASGSGKSTLARLLAGLLRPAVGTVSLEGRDVRRANPRWIAGRVGIVMQNPNHQLFARTVGEELALGPRNLGLAADEVARRVDEAAGRLDLRDLLGIHPYRLGLATRKRVALAAVLAMRPAVLIIDEPTAGQDAAAVAAITRLLVDARAAGTAVLTVTHDLRFAASVADRLLVLRDGRVVSAGRLRDALRDDGALRDVGLEAPQVVRLANRLGLAGPAGVPLDVDALAALITAVREGAGR